MSIKQRGQAIIEMLVVVVAIFGLLWALLWLQRWQQVKTQTQHHAALQAFRFSQSHSLSHLPIDTELQPAYLQGLYSSISHQEYSESLSLGEMPMQSPFLATAHNDGLFGDSERWRFQSRAAADTWQNGAWKQRVFDFMPEMQVQSQTSIWVGAGYAESDSQAVQRLQGSASLWGATHSASSAGINALAPFLTPVDAAWKRATPSTNWLQPWQESVPSRHTP